jgi:hypothetical protein
MIIAPPTVDGVLAAASLIEALLSDGTKNLQTGFILNPSDKVETIQQCGNTKHIYILGYARELGFASDLLTWLQKNCRGEDRPRVWVVGSDRFEDHWMHEARKRGYESDTIYYSIEQRSIAMSLSPLHGGPYRTLWMAAASSYTGMPYGDNEARELAWDIQRRICEHSTPEPTSFHLYGIVLNLLGFEVKEG